jgi:hypothetical protein
MLGEAIGWGYGAGRGAVVSYAVGLRRLAMLAMLRAVIKIMAMAI